MLKSDSTLKELISLIRNSDRSDYDITTSTESSCPIHKMLRLKVDISFVNSKQKITVMFQSFDYFDHTKQNYVLAPDQDDTIMIINQFFGKIDWNRRKIKFVLGEINTWSKDPSTKVSAAIFNGKYPICSSYNGLPPGVEDSPERLNNREIKYKIVQHAEANAISTCARLGIKTEGMGMAVSMHPCAACAGLIIGAGIKQVITIEPTEDLKARWGEDFELTKILFQEAGVELIVIPSDQL